MSEAQPSPAPVADPMVPESWEVIDRNADTHDTFSLRLRPAEGRLDFQPGQFNMLYCFGMGESAISISSDPADPQTVTHTIRRVGTVTNALAQLQPGDTLGVRGPFGTAWPLAEAAGKDVVFVAGGIGLAPLRPAICSVLRDRERYGRVVLLLGARTPADLLFADELENWRTNMEVVVTVDRSAPDWDGHVGVVTNRIPAAKFDPKRTLAMTCGPEIMMRYTVAELRHAGLADEQIHVSMERNMKCAVGFCGHCQYGPEFICKDGPVFRYDRIEPWFNLKEF